MRHFASPQFWKLYYQLPQEIQDLADSSFDLLKQNPKHPSLHFKRVGRFWSVRVGRKYRAVAVHSHKGPIWFWIGTHPEYDRLIKWREHVISANRKRDPPEMTSGGQWLNSSFA